MLEHWRKLKGPVHPLDAPLFENNLHSFNLEFPPPAYIGDLESGPVILLNASGGYDPIVTPSEFPDREAVDRYIGMLHHPGAIDPRAVAPYYAKRNYAALIARGTLVLVNAVAYRSPKISQEPDNLRIAELLPSTLVHRNWLRRELLPSARRGERLVIAHRTRLWKLRRQERDLLNVYFSPNPTSADLSKEALRVIADRFG